MKFKKAISLCLAFLLSSGATMFTACGGGDNSSSSSGGIIFEDEDNVTQLNIKIFNGGLGYAWLETIADDFMRTFKDVSFEPNKKGVKVNITPNKQFTDLHLNMASGADAEDIYYTATNNLYDFTSLGVAYDVTDIMTAEVYDADGNVKLNATGDGWETQERSLASRISVDYYKESFNLGSEAEPSYFAIPYEDSVSGFVVDWNLFVEEGWNNYSGLDGMPGTMTEFKDLLRRIQSAGYSAFSYSTHVGYYTPSIQRAVQAKVDGVDWFYDLFSDYTASYDFNNDGTIGADEQITPSTMGKAIDTRGVKAAVEMAEFMFTTSTTGSTYYDSNVVQGVSYGGAQQDFVMSKASNNRPRIAMLLEGEWWENETRATFNSMGRVNAANGYGKREFRFMPIPKMTNNDKTEKYTIGSFSSGYITVVNEKTVGDNSAKQRLVELFLQFQYSQKGLKTFTLANGATLPFEYELTESELNQLTPFGRSIWHLKHSDDVEIVYDSPMMRSREVRLGTQLFEYYTRMEGKAGLTDYKGCLFNNYVTFCQETSKVTVAEYLQGMHDYYDDKFAQAY